MSEREYERIEVRASKPRADTGADRWELRFESSPAALVVRLGLEEMRELHTHMIEALRVHNLAARSDREAAETRSSSPGN